MGNATLEEKIAHLERAVDDLSAVLARQDREIDRLSARVAMLMAREAEREAEALSGETLADRPPPHY